MKNNYEITVVPMYDHVTTNLKDFDGTASEFFERFHNNHDSESGEFDVHGMCERAGERGFVFKNEEIKYEFKKELFEYLYHGYLEEIKKSGEIKLGNEIDVAVTLGMKFINLKSVEYTQYSIMTEKQLIDMYLQGYEFLVNESETEHFDIEKIKSFEMERGKITEILDKDNFTVQFE
jgi:hypothetical protein